jgi:hypothetical protein
LPGYGEVVGAYGVTGVGGQLIGNQRHLPAPLHTLFGREGPEPLRR